jgi:uncharacterized protein with HEPN domain
MPDGRERGYLSDMVESARLIQSYVVDCMEEDFYADLMILDAVTRRLEIIGEAARRISDGLRLQIPQVPWRLIIGMRNRLIHEYDNVHSDMIWESTQKDMSPLIAALSPWVEGEERLGENF